MEIFFESEREVISFCEHLFQENKALSIRWSANENWGNRICIETEPLNEMKFQSIAQSMVQVYITYRFSNMIREIIRTNYYFSDQDEIEHIQELAEWIVTGEDQDSSIIRKKKHPLQLLRAIFLMHIRNSQTIYYNSVVQSGMKFFKQELIHYVGLAIDEFKREEEHQSFINTLREYIIKKEPAVPFIHVLEMDTFQYFDGQGEVFTNMDLKLLMKQTPLYLLGLPNNEWYLTPLIAMAPEKINMYVKDPSDPKIQTVINVFQEKVTIKGVNDFPYFYSRKS